MSTTVQPSAALIGSVNTQRVEDALSLIAPKWTTWVVQTLAQEGGALRVREISARLPFVTETYLSARLAQMHAGGLLTRANGFRAPYQLSSAGESLHWVHSALADWSRNNLPLGETAGAERVEDAVRRLHLRHTTAVVRALDANGPMRFGHIAEEAGLAPGTVLPRLRRLEADGLITQTGPRYSNPYALTDAGRALGPVYAAVEHWSDTTAAHSHPAPQAPVTEVTHARTGAPPEPDRVRTAAALRRSTIAPNVLFSHAPQPQPQVPAAVTAQSAPSRIR
ncbi:winged helix-turn-helix transcriptional regulator [Streptomyces sp. S6]